MEEERETVEEKSREDVPSSAGDGSADSSGRGFRFTREGIDILLLILVTCEIIFIIAFFVVPAINLHHCENDAMTKLRELGSCQLTYQGTNNDKFYGTINALQQMGCVEADKTLGTLIDGYRVSWRILNGPPYISGFSYGDGNNTFTILAYPQEEPISQLRTFGITARQVLRVYDPLNGNIQDSVNGWDKVEE